VTRRYLSLCNATKSIDIKTGINVERRVG